MARRALKHKRDQAVFARTAQRTRLMNITPKRIPRGGIRL